MDEDRYTCDEIKLYIHAINSMLFWLTSVGKDVPVGFVNSFVNATQYNRFSQLQLPDIETVECDVRDWDATRRAVEELGGIHLLVNNAGVADTEEALTATPESFDK